MNMQEFYSWGLPVGSIARIQIKVHWILLGFWLFDLDDLLKIEHIARPTLLWCWLLSIALVFVSILLHELGHCFAARSVGGSAENILLWPLGGLAFCQAPNLPRSQFIVAAGGPAVTIVIFLLSSVTFWIVGFYVPPESQGIFYDHLYYLLVRYQMGLLIFNLIPLYPLDGGRMFHALAWGYFGRRSHAGAYGRASLITVYVSRACVLLGSLYAIYNFMKTGDLWMLFIFAWAWSGTEGLRRRVREGEEEDYTFGYDFSRGYTSLEGSQPKASSSGPTRSGGWTRWLQGAKQRRAAKGQPSAQEKKRVDELLEKISRDGMIALTDEERKFLKEVGTRWGREKG